MTCKVSVALIFFSAQSITPVIDVVIPCHERDLITLNLVIQGARNNIDVRRIIVVSAKKLTDQAEWFSEQFFPFDQKKIAIEMFEGNVLAANVYMDSKKSRVGWMFQQLLKLYAPIIIPHISENVLILDADTIFLNPVKFFDNECNALYATRTTVYSQYIQHAQKLVPNFKIAKPNTSGVAHHMLMQKSVINDLFLLVQEKFKREFWRVFCNLVDKELLNSDAIYALLASEYEIYFNFAFSSIARYKVKVRELKRADIGSLQLLNQYKSAGYHNVSYHYYLR